MPLTNLPYHSSEYIIKFKGLNGEIASNAMALSMELVETVQKTYLNAKIRIEVDVME